jgi:hypothetical protein
MPRPDDRRLPRCDYCRKAARHAGRCKDHTPEMMRLREAHIARTKSAEGTPDISVPASSPAATRAAPAEAPPCPHSPQLCAIASMPGECPTHPPSDPSDGV